MFQELPWFGYEIEKFGRNFIIMMIIGQPSYASNLYHPMYILVQHIYSMSKFFLQTRAHEQSYLIEELESLGFHSMRLNELNDNAELRNLIEGIKESLLQQYHQGYKEHSER
jgi:hypothetical protein